MPDQENRPAIRVRRRIEIEFWSDSPPLRGHISDLSETGAFIDTTEVLPPGGVLEFRFDLPGSATDDPVRGKARVVWTDSIGLGVEFQDLDPSDQERLRFFVGAAFFNVSPEAPPEQ